eukprot:scaffold681797_cov42-Prasinocladus_malaysianus.AAC.1
METGEAETRQEDTMESAPQVRIPSTVVLYLENVFSWFRSSGGVCGFQRSTQTTVWRQHHGRALAPENNQVHKAQGQDAAGMKAFQCV